MSAPQTLNAAQRRFLATPGLKAVFDAIEAAGGQARVNGGAVRNAILGEPVEDIDLSTTLIPAAVTKALTAVGLKAVDTGVEHGTVTAVAAGRGYEITTLRRDVETHGRHATVRFGTDWRADAERRDFTMNALYCDRSGRLFDPLGGHGDIVAGRVRFIGEASARIAEDYLRILRFFRFLAWYGKGRPDADGLKACAAAREKIAGLSAERVWKEMKRLLAAPDPARALLWMRTCGVLGEVLPESAKWGIDALAGLVKLEAELALAPDPLLRLMAIVPPKAETAEAIATRWKLSNAERERFAGFAAAPEPKPDTSVEMLARQLYADPGRGLHDRISVAAARANAFDRGGPRVDQFKQLLVCVLAWDRPKFPLAGADLLVAGYTPGTALGAELARLEASWIDGGFAGTKAELLAHIRPPSGNGD